MRSQQMSRQPGRHEQEDCVETRIFLQYSRSETCFLFLQYGSDADSNYACHPLARIVWMAVYAFNAIVTRRPKIIKQKIVLLESYIFCDLEQAPLSLLLQTAQNDGRKCSQKKLDRVGRWQRIALRRGRRDLPCETRRRSASFTLTI